MDQSTFSINSLLETLLKTNRPPTEHEKAIIHESMAPSTVNLKAVEAQIFETTAHIQALKSQLRRAEIKLLRLRKEEAAILETSKDHRRVLSAVRNLPQDVLREILIACVQDKRPPVLSYRTTPLPYRLAQISSGFRRIALSTPNIWASMDVRFDLYGSEGVVNEQDYSRLAHRAREWFEQARGLPLTIFIESPCLFRFTTGVYGESDLSNILFDALLGYSARWKSIQFNSIYEEISEPVLRIIDLKAADVPLLQSVTLGLVCFLSPAVLSSNEFLTIPTLKYVSLETNDVRKFPVNWATLTAISLRGKSFRTCHSKSEVAKILQQTKCLVSCDIVVWARSKEQTDLDKISLPFLETLRINERHIRLAPATSPEAPSLLDHLIAPKLSELNILGKFLELSLINFLERSPNILKLDRFSVHFTGYPKGENE